MALLRIAGTALPLEQENKIFLLERIDFIDSLERNFVASECGGEWLMSGKIWKGNV